MAKLIVHCKYCNKPADVVDEQRLDAFGQIFKTYSCGHTVTEEIASTIDYAKDGYKLVCADCLVERAEGESFSEHINHNLVEIPKNRLLKFAQARPFQQQGVEFAEQANYCCAILDEMGLGKTIQACQIVAHAKDKLCAVLFVVKESLRFNWAREMVVNQWVCDGTPTDYPFIIMDGQMAVLPGFKYYIVGHGQLSKMVEWDAKKSTVIGLGPELKALGIKTIIVDESQAFSNVTSRRTKALLKIAETVPYRICLSGTPILNRASEYWPTLNLIKPDHWRVYKSFLTQWVKAERTESGGIRYTGIRESLRDAFFARIKGYVIRRRKRDVLKDLPKFTRSFQIVDVSQSNFKVQYNATASELDSFILSADYIHLSKFEKSSRVLGFLMKMRHLTGVMKTELAIEYINDFIESSEGDAKIIIGCHHDDVMKMLAMGLRNYNPVLLTGGMDDVTRNTRIEQFKRSESRVCLAKILASGEGLNLQFCQNMLVLERQWNPGKEEQFEARIDRYGQTSASFADYMIAKNTVDEIFTQMVEEKRKDCGGSVDKDYDFEVDQSLLMLLGERAAKLRV